MYDTITLPSQFCGFEQSDLPENANSFIQSIKGKHHFTICGCLPQMDLFDTRCCKCGREMHGHGYVTERLVENLQKSKHYQYKFLIVRSTKT